MQQHSASGIPISSVPTLLGCLLGCLLLGGCGEREPEVLPAPAAFKPYQFRDVPIPAGYQAVTGSDQLAVSYAGGSLRRYRATYERLGDTNAPELDELEDWYRQRLGALGWRISDEARTNRRWLWSREHRDGYREHLVLETGRADNRTIIRLSVAPAP